MKAYVYIVECADGTLYTGFTFDVEKRLEAHNAGKGAKYTRSRLPVQLVYFEAYETEREARSREWHLKRLTRAEKLALIDNRKCLSPSDLSGENDVSTSHREY